MVGHSFFGTHIPDNLKIISRQNQKSDGEKHYNIENAEPGYIFTADDDILYPDNYVQYMISKIEQYDRKHVITLHGRVWNELPIYSFYRDRKEGFNTAGAGMFRCLETVKGDHFVDCGGDGVMAYHTDTFRMRYEWVELPNMSQLWVALACNKLGIKQLCVEHEAGWINALWDGPGIWDTENENDSVQTNLVNTRWISITSRG